MENSGEVVGLSALRGYVVSLAEQMQWDILLPLLDRRWLEAWYAFPPVELSALLAKVAPAQLARYPGVRVLRMMVSGNPLLESLELAEVRGRETSFEHRASRLAIIGMQKRLAGYPNDALKLVDQWKGELGGLENPLIDSTNGYVPFLYLQVGVTALLAGEAQTAFALLERASEARSDTRFGFTRKDAHYKLAILHSVYGDTQDAVAALEKGDALPPSGSWIDQIVAQSGTIARMLIARDIGVKPPAAPTTMAVYGEMWPFAMLAQVRGAMFDQNLDLAERITASAERINLPGVAGDGIAAGAIPLSRANLLLARGHLSEARIALQDAPPYLLSARMTRARINYMRGDLDRVIADEGTTNFTGVHGFSRFNIEFAGILAATYLAKGEKETARSILSAALRGRPHLPATLRATIPRELAQFALENWDDMEFHALRPSQEPGEAAEKYLYAPSAGVVHLTPRERELLKELVRGRSQQEIARSMYLSTNTVKSHLRNLYRKLGVSRRDEAVLKGLSICDPSSL